MARRTMRNTLRASVAAACLAAGGLAAASQTTVQATAVAPSSDAPAASVYRVSGVTPSRLARLTSSYDVLEARHGQDYLVLGDATTAGRLRADGFRVSVDRRLPALDTRPGSARTMATDAVYPTFYGGYHTVAAHRQHLLDVAAAHPDLTRVVDYGDSWLKTQGRGGNDLLATCITKKAPGDCLRTPNAPKPRSVVYAAIHARELATAEIAWNWIDYLTTSYGTDPTVTKLLDTTEIWVIPVANPDGRQIVESGGTKPYYQRKNADDTGASCTTPPTVDNQTGVDMNRNATFSWGRPGSSTSPCSQTYRGRSAASEPETAAQQKLFNSLFKDRRGPGRRDAAPVDTTGTFITYHSYAGMTLYPWGDTTAAAPNRAKLRALASRMTAFTGYKIAQAPELLYPASGTTDDDLYGRLGVASFTTELGAAGTSCDGFMPPYGCVASTFWPKERQALTVLAQAAAGPYR